MKQYGVSLVLGGTGMFAPPTRWLAERSERTYLVARHASRFRGAEGIVPVDADWYKDDYLERIETALKGEQDVERAFLYSHRPEGIIENLVPWLARAHVVLVLGSRQARPNLPFPDSQLAIVKLGSKKTAFGRRWLTDEEMGEGALATVIDRKSRNIGDPVPA